MVENGKERWSSRLGFILASIGSAVGLGSIWKFPYEVGENGGASFVAFYLLGLALVVMPLLLAEFVIGRHGGADAVASVASAAAEARRSPRWAWAAGLAIASGFLILSYYAVIAGMTIAYMVRAIGTGFAGADGAAARVLFDRLVADPAALAAWQAAFLAATGLVVARGIGSGVEAACKVLMPLLAGLMLVLVAYAAIEGDMRRAVDFLVTPRLDALTPRAALEALGLGFFSIGVGLGVMVTYAAYAGRDVDLGAAAWTIVLGDTAISLLAGLAVFPLVFAHGLDPAEGVGLMFLTLPIAFGRLPFGDLVGTAFFLLLFIAALASAMSLMELCVAPVMRRMRWSRQRATLIVGAACWIAGIPTVLSFNLWSDLRPLAAARGFETWGVFEVIDGAASNLLLPAAGFLFAVFAGWVMRPDVIAQELGWRRERAAMLVTLLRWVAPALILAFVGFGHLVR